MSPQELHASPLLRWPGSVPHREESQALAARAAERAENGQLIGIGSGSHACLTLWELRRRVDEQGLAVTVACSGYEAETAALNLGLSIRELGSADPDWGIDSAEEVDPDHRLLKRPGRALVSDRLLWSTTGRMYLAVAATERVEALGRSCPLPVEVHRDAVALAARELAGLGASDVALRLSAGKDGPVITGSGNLLLDARFPHLAPGLGAEIRALPGVIETGLFEGYEFESL